MRTLDGDKFSAKKPREWNDKELLVHWRESWARAENDALEKAGRPERVDHRSLKDRGIDRIPEPKIGKEAMGMKQRGVVEDPERFKLVRWVKSSTSRVRGCGVSRKPGKSRNRASARHGWNGQCSLQHRPARRCAMPSWMLGQSSSSRGNRAGMIFRRKTGGRKCRGDLCSMIHLAQYRRKSPPPGYEPPPNEPEKYMAFDTKDKVFRLRIRGADDSIYAPGYNILLNLLYDKQGTHFILTYTVMMVLVRGKNLQKVVFAIENGMADFIQEFDFKRWPEPTDATAPFIESIEVKVNENGSAANETKH